MKLILTHFIDAGTDTAVLRLPAAIAAGLDAAALRSAGHRSETLTSTVEHGFHIEGGLDALTGTDCVLTGSDRLTELRVEVPWAPSDSGTTKLWAANRFAGVLAEQLAAA